MLNSLRELFKTNIYAIVTALVLAAAITGYVVLIMPMQKDNEDKRNQAIFQNVKQQLLGYVDDQVKAIDKKGINIAKKKFTDIPGDTTLTIQSVEATSAEMDKKPGRIIVWRNISFKTASVKGVVKDSVSVDISKFVQQISSLKKFDAFYICKFNRQEKKVESVLVDENVVIADQDSLQKDYKKEGGHEFKNANKRYYSGQVFITADFSLYIAAGLDNADFDAAVRSISPGLLIFSLMVIILLILSLSLIKPVLSDEKERMSQRDFISVAFSTGALIAVLIAFGGVMEWGAVLKHKNQSDLELLAGSVSKYFTEGLEKHQHDRETILSYKPPYFARMEVSKNQISFQKDSLQTPINKPLKNLESFDRLQEYFTMDSTGLIKTNRNKQFPGIKRIYKDREYFRMLKDPDYHVVLTTVLSRRDHAYQWIYATKNTDGSKGITGIAFLDSMSKDIRVPPGTAFVIVNSKGDILFQNEPGKVLRGNLLEGTSNEAELLRLLAGNDSNNFTTEYQGVKYQMFGQKLKDKNNKELSDNAIYVIAMRDLSFQESLSLFSFSNTFLITLLYGIFIMLLMMVYSAVLHSGKMSVFSKQHLSYLFPNNSRTTEYTWLFWINLVFTIGIAVGSLFMPPPTAVWCCIIAGVNIAFLNFAMLNNTMYKFTSLLLVMLVLFVIVGLASALLLSKGIVIGACILPFLLHFALILWHRKWERKGKPVAYVATGNKGVNRNYYTRFFTMVLLKHFGLLPFLLCSAIYINELNDVSTWYCAKPHFEPSCTTRINGCDCDPKQKIAVKDTDKLARFLDVGLLRRPSDSQLDGFNFTGPKFIYYLNILDVFDTGNASGWCVNFLIILFMILIYFLAKALADYYSNRFFFYSLMQAGYEHYFKGLATPLPAQEQWPCENAPKSLKKPATYPILFTKDKKAQLWPMHKNEFIMHENLKKYKWEYENAWSKVPSNYRNVLFDFSRDHFVNYKNRDILIDLMEQGIIDCDPTTGRLKITNEFFRSYIILTYRSDPKFIAKFREESKDGFFTKLRLPLIIIAVSLLVLLIYLNKSSFDNLIILGTTVTTALGFVNKFMGSNKPAV